jgi:S-adenosylmethionine hydrolase
VKPSGIVTLATDFGHRDGYIGALHGVIRTIAPEVQVVDCAHELSPFNTLAAALAVRSYSPYFPVGTVHCVVVDPTVGSDRRAILVETARAWFVGPDNGVFTFVGKAKSCRTLDNPLLWRTQHPSSTFHGRDLFAPVAAAVATDLPPEDVGPKCDDPVVLDWPVPKHTNKGVQGEVVYVDWFGNAVTNLRPANMPGQNFTVAIKRKKMPLCYTYSDVQPGEAVAVINSWGLLEVAVREGSAVEKLGIELGTHVTVAAD